MFPASVVEMTVLPSLCILSIIVKDEFTKYGRIVFWALFSVLLVFMLLFLSVSYCFNYCSFVVFLYYCTNTIAVTLHKSVKIAQKEWLKHKRTDDKNIVNTTTQEKNTTTQNNSYSENNKQSPLHVKTWVFLLGDSNAAWICWCYFCTNSQKGKISSS